ncbi:Metallo-beta-lactamase superfamily hydrolase [Nitrospira sp. KM1]|uniref:MBL fold metallo-hydrolase n=1 Tax=Nitrospira sp. KM1 TaxID=1936990 RepID=UPI0013A76D48|nr:MBL fold metallo-hydrolase [Nitrospira sp. KM1]BCA55277.1 Metallo-beta-lactamase superfamily hydrolase [Nitrospira sp. KM1]
MANANKRLDSNVQGNFYVDATCIDCDTCRQLAPDSFEEVGDYSAVTRQPQGEEQTHRAYQALLACPVGSIGTEQSEKGLLHRAMDSFPLPIEAGVSYCGFNSEKSFGANSFFVEHPDGNWLIDSPRYLKHLVESFEQRGGIANVFLTHRDDVADAERYARHFGARRIIHRADSSAVPDAEWVIDAADPVMLATGFELIPVPGHTPGSCALLYDERFLFTGDHLWWEPSSRRLGAPHNLVWNRHELYESIEKLLDHRFEWVLAGHGDRVRLIPEDMKAKLRELLQSRRPGPRA